MNTREQRTIRLQPGECPICVAREEDGTFPSVRERLREAEQALLEAGQMLAEADRRVWKAEAERDRALAALREVERQRGDAKK